MSVLNQSGEEQVECPLCMEPLEVDDLTFFPCTCGYQICRFCWHRIRTDENGLCPACRKAYSEDPADFIPLSQEQMAKLKAEKRQRDQQRKAKLTESRKHLASVRVVQRNLVFVVGLPMRLADPEVLKRHEYFGKFGKIHKVVINQSTSYAGSQGPSASAYVTYMKSDDALRAIQSVNNITIDGRVIKSSLGTTKYCSHFMKNQTCPKPDCMYLHDFGDPEASFTKEQMHAGKHQEYEKKLHENLLVRTANNNNQTNSTETNSKSTIPIPTTNSTSKENVNAPLSSSVSSSSSTTSNSSGTNKENWPHLNNTEKERKEKEKGKKTKGKSSGGEAGGRKVDRKETYCGKSDVKVDKGFGLEDKQEKITSPPLSESSATPSPPSSTEPHIILPLSKLPPIVDDNTSFFSMNPFQKITHGNAAPDHTETENETTHPSSILTDTLPNINTTEDWAAAFGFPRNSETGAGKREEKDVLDSFRKGFGGVNHDTGYSKGIEPFNNGFYEMSSKLQDMLSGKATPVYPQYKQTLPQATPPPNHTHNGLNGLDQNMSKFFMEFHKNSKDMGTTGQQQQQYNGYNGVQQGYFSGLQNSADRITLLQQKQLEEHILNLSLKQGFGGSSNSLYQNGGVNVNLYMNGENGGFGNLQGPQYNSSSNVKQTSRSSEDDLGFDPFQETQKAFADLMASEQNQKSHNSSIGRSQINGVNLNQNGHLPPPPPGFVQPNSHMNSFGSKILPYLNMSNSQQQINSSTQNNWPSNYNSHHNMQQQQQKNLNNTCNDWKVLDPAILSSSRHYPLANMPQLRDHYSNLSQIGTQQQIQNGGAPPLRPYEYTNSPFSNFTQQLQPNFNNFSHLNSQQNLNWYSNDLNSQISSPPGFRNNPATKQQEC